MNSRNLAVTLGVAGALVVASAGSAYAAVSGNFTLGTTGVSFASGSYNFYSNSSTGADFGYRGDLRDTASDGNNVFVHGKVAGYGYGPRLYGPGFKEQFLNDPAATSVSTGGVQACQDRGTAFSDLCSTRSFTR